MIVIADDMTGAAEIAGIAFQRGCPVQLTDGSSVACSTLANSGSSVACGFPAGITVIATDLRSMTETDAVAETRRITSHYPPLTPHLFLKTDSALRGHVVAELTAVMQSMGYNRAVYLPANPSKGRTIVDGIYYINGTPIHETDFRFDPEFPATTSVLSERFPDAAEKGIIMPDAASVDDISRVVSSYDDGRTLFAGAADLFEQLLLTHRKINKTLILCGSTQSRPPLDIPIAPMPREIYDGDSNLSLWDTSAYTATGSLALTIPYTHRTGREVAVHLRSMMAAKARELVAESCPDHLVIEGGATAWATLSALGWSQLNVNAQLAPGVVRLQAACGTLVTLKPGSYPWTL